MTDQRQESGSESANIQAGRDVVVHQGISLADAQALFDNNFLRLEGMALETARSRAEEITKEFLEQLRERSPSALPSGAEPDMQQSLFNAQRGYVLSGEEELRQTLIDLLVDRAGQSERGLEAIVLNEAIVTAPKLTLDQRRAVAAAFLIRYTGWAGGLSLDLFYDYLAKQILPVAIELPTTDAPYQHIEYVGAGAISPLGGLDFYPSLVGDSKGIMTRGFTTDEVPETCKDLIEDARFFRPCIRDPERLQLVALDTSDVDRLTEEAGEERAGGIRQLWTTGLMTDTEIQEEAESRVPGLAAFARTWSETPLRKLTLTSVGIAIGHGYWRRLTGSMSPLFIWIK